MLEVAYNASITVEARLTLHTIWAMFILTSGLARLDIL